MSEIRLVRCPKCNKVLPELDNVIVYQCGACGTLLRSEKSILGGGLSNGSENLVSSDKGGEAEVDGLIEGSFDGQKGMFDMSSMLLMRSKYGDGIGSKSPIKESHLNELIGGSPKSSTEKEFFSDNASVLDSSFRQGSGLRMRGRGPNDFDFDGDGKSMRSLRGASKSPLWGEVGGQTPVSVRSRHFSRSPMRGFSNSPIRGNLVSEFDENAGRERGVCVVQDGKAMKVHSFTTWLPDDKPTRQSNVKHHEGRRSWRDQHGNGVDQISEGREPIRGSDYGTNREGSANGFDTEKMHRDLQLKNDNVGGYGMSRGSIDQWVIGRHGHSSYHPDSTYGYDGQRHDFDTMREPARVQDVELVRVELLQKYNELKDQLSGLDNKTNSSSPSHRGGEDYLEDEYWRYRQESLTRQPHRKPPHGFLKHSIPGHIPCQSLDFDPGSLKSYNGLVPGHFPHHSLDFDRNSLDERRYHHPACACSLCFADRTSVRSAPKPRVERYAHRRTLVTTAEKRLCYPLAGGSPFVLCCKCFRLLKLPGKLRQKNYDQLQCGACATIISFDLQTMSFGLFLPQQNLNSVGSDSGMGKVSASKHVRGMTATSTNFGSYDFDAESGLLSKGQRISDNLHHLSPSASHKSQFSHNLDTASVRSPMPTSTEKPFINLVRPPAGSTLGDHMEYSDVFRKLQAADIKTNEGSLENAAISTKAEVHPGKVEEDKAANSKDKHSSIAGLVKWGFASKSGRASPRKTEVYVNGQPISHRMVKKAEKFSGPIEHGEYWYDSKAGFWGVMGHRCLGIIPSSIQELNFPMPANCSGGDTTIYVNGRQLHKRDMDLLTSRGLPITGNMRYIIDISGRVVDEATREFVVNLGKLAPSIEMNRCGFGMKVPEKLED